jgi:Uma2 family endonuclease
MSMPQHQREPKLTVDEYLRFERAADQRHEFLDGKLIAMAGESGNHADISTNVVISIGAQLKGKDCRARTKDTKIRSGPDRPHGSNTKGLFSYPDVVVICGEPVYHDEHNDVVLNPTAIVEVLSPSTEAFDRGEKFIRLRSWNPSLMDYVLISQTEPLIEVFHRTGETTWSLTPATGLLESAAIESIACRLPLSEVYDRVEFRPSEPPEADPPPESPE